MFTFDLYLVNREDEPCDLEGFRRAFGEERSLRPDPQDPDRYVYRNLNTSVFFAVFLRPGLVRRPRPADPYAGALEEAAEARDQENPGHEEDSDGESGDGGERGRRGSENEGRSLDDDGGRGGADPDGAGESYGKDNKEAEDGEGGEDGGDEDGEGPDEEGAEGEEPSPLLELAPVHLSIPLFCPSFFVVEALQFARRLGLAGNLLVDSWIPEVPETHAAGENARGEHPLPGGVVAERLGRESGASARLAGSLTDQEILLGWAFETRVAISDLQDPKKVPPHVRLHFPAQITVWGPGRAAAWWSYGSSRRQLQAELAGDGVVVPVLQLARHEGTLKTLCVWEVAKPTALPRSDLVLVRKERERKGIFRSKKVVEEGITTGERIWDILGPFGEIRKEPVEVLIFREAKTPPTQVQAELEVLTLEPVESARRTELFGVIDFDPRLRPVQDGLDGVPGRNGIHSPDGIDSRDGMHGQDSQPGQEDLPSGDDQEDLPARDDKESRDGPEGQRVRQDRGADSRGDGQAMRG